MHAEHGGATGAGGGVGGGSNVGAGVFEYRGRRVEIRDVWASNLDEEMANIRDIVEEYPYIAMVRAQRMQESVAGSVPPTCALSLLGRHPVAERCSPTQGLLHMPSFSSQWC